MKQFIKSATLSIVLATPLAIFAQGCSDAGFCTIGNLAPQAGNTNAKNKITVQLPIGQGDENVLIFAPAIQYDRMFNKRWSAQAKLTASYASGNLGNAAGPGDLFLSGSYDFPMKKDSWKWSVTLGAKLPLSQSNLRENRLSLPMQYQSSLGTIDAIAGISIHNHNWQFSAGWQQPLSGTNGNNFLPLYWASGTKAQQAAAYIPSNDFNRKADILLRGLYKKEVNQKFSFNAGLLAIYHIGNDTYIDGSISSKPIDIDGSRGFTLNVSTAGWLKLNDKIAIGLTVAVPVIVRTLRPDGLTRSFLAAPEIRLNF